MSERTEDQLRDAIRAYTETVEPSPGGWSWIERRLEPKQPRRSRPAVSLVGAVALVTALALVVVLVAQLRGGGSRLGTVGEGRAPLPDLAVVVKNDGVTVVSTRTGEPVRNLASSEEGVAYSGVSVSEARDVYFGRSMPNANCADSSSSEIVRVPISGGPAQVVGRGMDPMISPDGRWLAYGRNTMSGCLGDPNAIYVVKVAAPNARDHLVTDIEATGAVYATGWSSDSSRLLYERHPTAGGRIQRFEWNRATERPRKIALPAGAHAAWYLGKRGFIAAMDSSRFAVTFDSSSGKVREKLFDPPNRIQPFLASDRSGRHVLFSVADPQDNSAPGRELWRWSDGSTPKRIPIAATLEHPSDAVFVPQASPTKMPNQIVSVIDGNLVVLDSESGSIVRTLTGAGQPSSPSVGADGFVYFSRHPSRCEIARVVIGRRRPRQVASGFYAKVSPNGRWLAVVADANHSCQGGLDVIDVVDLQGQEPMRSVIARARVPRDSLSSGDYGFELIAWSTDSRRVLLRTPAGYTYHIDLFSERVTPAFHAGYPMTYLGSSERYVGAINLGADGGFQLLAFDVDARVHRLARARRGNIVTLTADRSGRHLLYWVANQDGQTQTLWRKTLGDAPVRLRTERAHSSGGLPAVWVP